MSILPEETEISTNAVIEEIKRPAIGLYGRLGSLYDGYRDRLVDHLTVVNQENYLPNKIVVQSKIIYGNNDQPQNLLRQLSINEQFRLSILLNMTPSEGLAALIDYSHLTNEHTRLFRYSYVDRVQKLPDRIEDAKECIHSSISPISGTHIITGIEWGIDLVVVLQLPPDENTAKEIHLLLDKLLTFVLDDNMTYTLTSDEENVLEKIVYTKVYANTPHLNNLTTVRDVCCRIKENTSPIIDYPISYTLRPIKWLNPQYNTENATFAPLPVELNDQIEDYVLQLKVGMKTLEISVAENTSKLRSEPLKEELSNIQKKCLDVQDKFNNELKRLSKIIIEIRGGRTVNSATECLLSNGELTTLKNNMNDLIQNLQDLKEKEQFQSSDVADPAVVKILIESQSVDDAHPPQFACSNDGLEENNAEPLQNLRSDFKEEPKNDFIDPNCSNDALDSSETPSETENHEDPNDPMPDVLPTEPHISTPPPADPDIPNTPTPPVLVPTDETINILLLGETGVGKSTFINAFANYLTFNTLQQAENGQPVVIIPVSFLITVGDNFEEHLAEFGNTNDSNNEDFQHPGQSVTQRCKSHEFDLNHTDGKKLRIIDTPGFGDTRGLDQDDRNMAHILEYIKGLSHINAICFLLKPNESRLNIFYKSCVTQLFSLLKSNPCDNIIFCFTNARSTFYTPGDTAPLLKKMLNSPPKNEVPFKKDNTFCFDSESFRYLVALQNQIKFNDLEREEYEISWTRSVTESNRLVQYVCEKLTVHRIEEE